MSIENGESLTPQFLRPGKNYFKIYGTCKLKKNLGIFLHLCKKLNSTSLHIISNRSLKGGVISFKYLSNTYGEIKGQKTHKK